MESMMLGATALPADVSVLPRRSLLKSCQMRPDLPDLPEGVIEMIISKLPYSEIFKNKILSKAWLLKFSDVGFIHDNAEKDLVRAFQKQVTEQAKDWKIYGPALLDQHHSSTIAKQPYNQHILPSLAFLPEYSKAGCIVDAELPLVLEYDSDLNLFAVANIITRSWKELPSPPEESQCKKIVSTKLVRFQDSYMVIIYSEHVSQQGYLVHIYDSRLQVWTTTTKHPRPGLAQVAEDSFSNPVLLNADLYTATGRNPCMLVIFNLESKTALEIVLNLPTNWNPPIPDLRNVYVAVYEGDVLVIVIKMQSERLWGVSVLKVNFESNKLKLMSKCPRIFLRRIWNNQETMAFNPISHGTSVFMGMLRGKMLEYNVRENKWNTFTIAKSVARITTPAVILGQAFSLTQIFFWRSKLKIDNILIRAQIHAGRKSSIIVHGRMVSFSYSSESVLSKPG